jgi:hypothetical protein
MLCEQLRMIGGPCPASQAERLAAHLCSLLSFPPQDLLTLTRTTLPLRPRSKFLLCLAVDGRPRLEPLTRSSAPARPRRRAHDDPRGDRQLSPQPTPGTSCSIGTPIRVISSRRGADRRRLRDAAVAQSERAASDTVLQSVLCPPDENDEPSARPNSAVSTSEWPAHAPVSLPWPSSHVPAGRGRFRHLNPPPTLTHPGVIA